MANPTTGDIPSLRSSGGATTAPALQPQPMRYERHAAPGALRGAELCPALGVGRQAVVDVDGRQQQSVLRGAAGGRIEQHHRIDATGQRHGEARTRGEVLSQRRSDGGVDGGERVGGINPR